MATELKYPSALPMSRNGSCLFQYQGYAYNVTDGLKFNTGETSGWTQLDGDQEVPEGYPTIAFTQRDSPRKGGAVYVLPQYFEDYSTSLFFQVIVQECSNGHKFWLGQTLTVVYTVTTLSGEEEVTFTYTLSDDDFKTAPAYPTDMPDVPFPDGYLYYGYIPANDTLEGGRYYGKIVQTTDFSDYVTNVIIKSAEATPHDFFQYPGG